MASYLEICGWSGCEKIPVTVIGERDDDFEIEAEAQAFLPGRGTLKKGECLFVPKKTVTFTEPAGNTFKLAGL